MSKEEQKIILAEDGKTKWRIVTGRAASEPVKYAAKELQRFFRKVSGAKLPIVNDGEEPQAHEIFVGASGRTAGLGFDLDSLGPDGFFFRTTPKKIVIIGGEPRGTLYGVYDFLERFLGCRWLTPDVSRIPERSVVSVPVTEKKEVPALEYREDYYRNALDQDWCARNRVLGQFPKIDEKHGGTVRYNRLGFVHTFDALVPVEEFFDTHPEYFSEVDGKRVKERTQLCLTNPDVLRIATQRVLEALDKDPEAKIISVAQNDCYNPCQCKKCRAIDEREGSHSGTLLWFVNQIAAEVAKKRPDVKVDTLAYQYTRKPPKTIRPAPNVIVRLCSIECCFSHPLDRCDAAPSFRTRTGSDATFVQDLEGWAKICDQLYIWDYVTNFSHYVMPFPDFAVLAPNIQFFIKNHVTGIFEEGNGESCGGEFAELRAYMLAKLLWNPDQDVSALMNEFLTGYYGMAAAPIRSYIDMLQHKVASEGIHMGIYDPPTSAYLTHEVISRADKLFDEAEALADDEEVLRRVRLARLPVEYVKMATMAKDDPNRLKAVEHFFSRVDEEKIKNIRESWTVEKSRKAFEEDPDSLFPHS